MVILGNTGYISEWRSKRLSDEIIKPPTTSDNSLALALSYIGNNTRVKFAGSCLKQDKTIFTHRAIVNIYIVYEISVSDSNNNYPTFENSLFGAVKLAKNADIDKYKYSGYGIGFDRRGTFSFTSSRFCCNVIIFGVDMSSSVHVDNKKKDILILDGGLTQGLNDATLIADKNYPINFIVTRKKFCLSLHYNGVNSYLFINGTDIIKF